MKRFEVRGLMRLEVRRFGMKRFEVRGLSLV